LMDANPYAPPDAPLESPQPVYDGRLLPFEDKTNIPGLFFRIKATFRVFWTDTELAGEGLGLRPDVAPAIAFYALAGMPVAIAAGVAQIFFPIQPWFLSLMGAPRPVAPTGTALVFALIGVILAPLWLAIIFAIAGLLNHAGLWLVGGTQTRLGLPVTYRMLLYGAATLAVPVSLAELALARLPGSLGTLGQVVAFGAQLGIFFYQGVIFARAHRTDTWRGVLGLLMPPLLLGLLCGGCIGVLWVVGGEPFREALQKALSGGS
jgi:hypothetical protein